MRRVIIVSCLLVLISFTGTSGVAAKAPEDTDAGALFGGQWAWANNTSSQTSTLNSLPAIAEDYTATWCTNCVKVEHVLEELQDSGEIQKYHFHRANDHEDPFGSNNTEQHFSNRYTTGAPPVVVFNGTQKQIGSSPNGESLQEDYRSLISQSLDLGSGNTTLSWTSQNEDAGVVSWAVDLDMAQFEGYEMSVNIWFVEASAEFSEGSNGEGTYPSIVTQIVEVGNVATGTATVSIPTAYDGDDMQVHLMYHFTPMDNGQNSGDEEVKETDDSSSLPSISIIVSLSCIIVAAAMFKK